MAQEEINPNPMFLVSDLLEEIFLRLPLKSVFKFKTVSKQFRTIMESRRFLEMRMNLNKTRKILVAGDHRIESLFEPIDKEIEFFYYQFDNVTRSLTCDGLVCILSPNSIKVLNPFTRQFIDFPCHPYFTPRPVICGINDHLIFENQWYDLPTMGFGKDKVNGSYKVVRMLFDPKVYCKILDVNIGEWRELPKPPTYKVETRKSACVNGSIYWLELVRYNLYRILALDLHTEEFRDVPPPPVCGYNDEIVNLEDRLAIATNKFSKLEIWCIDAQEERWSMTYSMRLSSVIDSRQSLIRWFRPLAVSKQGNLFFYDNNNRLFKYYPENDLLCCLSPNICAISPIVENLMPLQRPFPIHQGQAPQNVRPPANLPDYDG